MKVYLLRFNDGEHVFYSEEPEAVADDALSDSAAPRNRGAREWCESKYKSWHASLQQSESGIGLRVRRMWEWLERRISSDEALLRRLRSASVVEIYYPTMITPEQAGQLWTSYLKSHGRYHLVWLVIDALGALATLPLIIMPGPNVLGYPLTYRAICHLLALRGAQNAKGDQVATTFLSSNALDNLLGGQDITSSEQVAYVAASFGLKDLDAFINRTAAKRESLRTAPLAVR